MALKHALLIFSGNHIFGENSSPLSRLLYALGKEETTLFFRKPEFCRARRQAVAVHGGQCRGRLRSFRLRLLEKTVVLQRVLD